MTDPIDLDAAEALFQAGDWAASIQHARRRTGLAIVAELRGLRQFERFIREQATNRNTRALTLVENFDAGHRLPEEGQSGAEHGA